MRPEFVLVLGCLGLGLVIAYALWASVRVTLLQLDLRNIIRDMDAAARARGAADDPLYLTTRKSIHQLIVGAPYLYISLVLIFLRGEGARRERLTRELSTNAMTPIADWGGILPPEVQEARFRVVVRLIVHFVFSPVDLAIFLLMYASGQSERLISWVTASGQDLTRFGRYASSHVDIPTKAV